MEMTREESISARRVFVFGGFKRTGEQNYLVADISTKTVYIGSESLNGVMKLTELSSEEYSSMMRGLQKGDVKDLDIMPGSLVPNRNGSMSFLAQSINFENAMPEKYTLQ
ncbi:MAG: hypothetical protein NTU57_02965 [Candidatus Aenigmarchaeota archaeon]|nr:hypothetical protein [Candidatus Aenigmarchaeota archaeon]